MEADLPPSFPTELCDLLRKSDFNLFWFFFGDNCGDVKWSDGIMSTTTQVVSSFSPLVFRACCMDITMGIEIRNWANRSSCTIQGLKVVQLNAELPWRQASLPVLQAILCMLVQLLHWITHPICHLMLLSAFLRCLIAEVTKITKKQLWQLSITCATEKLKCRTADPCIS